MERPVLYVNAGGSHQGGKHSKSWDEQVARPERIADVRFGQVWLVTFRGRTSVEVM